MKNFNVHLIQKIKRHLKYDFQAKYSQLKQFQKIQIFQK